MKAAALTSPRLQRVLAVLSDGEPHSTRDIMMWAQVCAVNTCIGELREHGAEIDVTITTDAVTRARIWNYRMTKGPKA
ncbi:hypothetical protein [Sagittula sp. S175]|uniref:hypothetical protein n=1 Tax=Sagittula sp. S175 TaxID=3415129 RepID=UPI003C7ECA9C